MDPLKREQSITGVDLREESGGAAPRLFLGQIEARRTKQIVLESRPPSFLGTG